MPLMTAPAVTASFRPAVRASNMKMTPSVLTVPMEVPSKRLSKVHSRNTHRGKYVGFTSGSVLLIMNGMVPLARQTAVSMPIRPKMSRMLLTCRMPANSMAATFRAGCP